MKTPLAQSALRSSPFSSNQQLRFGHARRPCPARTVSQRRRRAHRTRRPQLTLIDACLVASQGWRPGRDYRGDGQRRAGARRDDTGCREAEAEDPGRGAPARCRDANRPRTGRNTRSGRAPSRAGGADRFGHRGREWQRQWPHPPAAAAESQARNRCIVATQPGRAEATAEGTARRVRYSCHGLGLCLFSRCQCHCQRSRSACRMMLDL